MKKKIIAASLLLTASLFALPFPFYCGEKPTDVIATVNNHILYRAELDRQVEAALLEKDRSPSDRAEEEAKAITRDFIRRAMLRDEVRRVGAPFSETEYLAWREKAKTEFDALKTEASPWVINTPGLLREGEINLLTDALLKAAGFTPEPPSDEEVRTLYETLSARFEADAKRAADAERKLAEGASFESVVAEFSDEPEILEQTLDGITRMFQPAFCAALPAADPGSIIDVTENWGKRTRAKIIDKDLEKGVIRILELDIPDMEGRKAPDERTIRENLTLFKAHEAIEAFVNEIKTRTTITCIYPELAN